MDERLLTPEQVAKILQIHQFTVLKFIKQGRLKASKIGRAYRIRQSDLELFLDQTSERPVKQTKTQTQSQSVSNQNTETKTNFFENTNSPSKNALEKQTQKTTEIKIETVDNPGKKVAPENKRGEDHFYILD